MHRSAARADLAPIRSGIVAPLFPPHLTTARALVEAPNTATPTPWKLKLDKPQELGHNKDAATDKPRTRWETGN